MQNGPIFVRRRLQITYNQKTCYLPIFEDCRLHKPLLKKALQKHQKMQLFSMDVTYWLVAIADISQGYQWNNETYCS
jgi:hypothetical protein